MFVREKKRYGSFFLAFLAMAAMAAIFVIMPFYSSGANEGKTLYELLNSFLETDFDVLLNGLKTTDLKTIIDVVSYGILVALLGNLVIMLLNLVIPIRIGLFKFLNFITALACLLVAAAGVAALVMFVLDKNSVNEFSYYAYAYFGLGVITPIISMLFLKRNKIKE